MTYINLLQHQNRVFAKALRDMQGGLNGLIKYLTSEKFVEEHWVNPDDVIMRIREIQDDVSSILVSNGVTVENIPDDPMLQDAKEKDSMKKMAQVIQDHIKGEEKSEKAEAVLAEVSAQLKNAGFKPPFKLTKISSGKK